MNQIDQQQYPRVEWYLDSGQAHWIMAYEYRANTFLRRSADGLMWSAPVEAPLIGIWRTWLMPCRPEETIGLHPYSPGEFDCLTGGPPGLYIDNGPTGPELYLFVALGQNPSAMGCYRGPLAAPAALLRKCNQAPLFTGSTSYGPADSSGAAAQSRFDFRTISSAEVVRIGERVYMLYEGVRGPKAGDAGDTQFGLGLARSHGREIDGPWERHPPNPILLDLPGNVGVGHADLIMLDMLDGVSYLYTSLDGASRSRLRLVWN